MPRTVLYRRMGGNGCDILNEEKTGVRSLRFRKDLKYVNLVVNTPVSCD